MAEPENQNLHSNSTPRWKALLRKHGISLVLLAAIAYLWLASPLLAVWGRALGDAAREDQLFPGLTLVVLCLVAVLGSRFWTAPWLSRGSRWCLGAAAAFGTLAGVAAVAATSFTVFGVRVSLGRVDRPLAWTWLFVLAALALAPPVRRAWRDRSIPGLYTLSALVCWLLSLGPEARLMGERVWYKSPYSWLLLLPGLLFLRRRFQ